MLCDGWGRRRWIAVMSTAKRSFWCLLGYLAGTGRVCAVLEYVKRTPYRVNKETFWFAKRDVKTRKLPFRFKTRSTSIVTGTSGPLYIFASNGYFILRNHVQRSVGLPGIPVFSRGPTNVMMLTLIADVTFNSARMSFSFNLDFNHTTRRRRQIK